MTATLLISSGACALMIADVIFLPQIRIKRFTFDSYWMIVFACALFLLVFGLADARAVASALVADTAINPLKIAVLFISMTILSVYLDEVGFFRYMAHIALRHAGTSQLRLFFYLYLTVSVLTVFTSNDIIVLTFTPFICYFAKNAGISPIPFLVSEFVAANTWSMALIIGNPTNVYLSATYGLDFIAYLRVMILPTVAAGIAAFLVLWLLFRKALHTAITPIDEPVTIKDKGLLVIGLVHLGGCTVLLAVASYIGLDMWKIALFSALSLYLVTFLFSLLRRKKPVVLAACTRRAPWQLLPFILSMFVIILALGECGITAKIAAFLGNSHVIGVYGVASALSANVINNIPMSVLFCSLVEPLAGETQTAAVLATVIGSNLGALITPIGALAGIMWTGILKKHGLEFHYGKFIVSCAPVGLSALAAALATLAFVL